MRIFGENGLDEGELHKLSEHDKKRLFGNNKPLARIVVLCGGVIFNIACAYVLFVGAFMWGSNVFLEQSEIATTPANERKMLVVDLNDKSPLQGSGMQAGDVITGVVSDGEILTGEALSSFSISDFIQAHNNSQITFFYKTEHGESKEATAVPRAGIIEGKKIIGAKFVDSAFKKYSLPDALVQSFKTTYEQLAYIFTSLYSLIYGALFENVKVEDNLSGPIGLAVMTSKVSTQGFDQILIFAGMLSLSLAAFNILPIPALDGGRIVFVFFEMLRRKKIKANTEQLFHGLGFLALLCLMVFVTYFDIVKAFN